MTRVLIVDDDFMVAKVHAGFVAALDGFEVVGTASSGAAALAEVARLRPDLVLLDVYLPDMTGLEVLRRLRADAVPVDVVVISAARDVESIRSALHGGVLSYLVKPFDRQTFEARLREYAALRSELAVLQEAGQADVDRLFAGARSGPRPAASLPAQRCPRNVVGRARRARRVPVAAQRCIMLSSWLRVCVSASRLRSWRSALDSERDSVFTMFSSSADHRRSFWQSSSRRKPHHCPLIVPTLMGLSSTDCTPCASRFTLIEPWMLRTTSQMGCPRESTSTQPDI